MQASIFREALYPLVMDTPFGNTDDGHSNNIARYIPELADQVIILASNKNWSQEIDRICRLRIGREYSLIHFSPSPKSEIDQKFERKSDTGYEHSKLEEGHYAG
jgi:DNA sulfur modification protein DndD